jgi:tetraacyldisaccharide 4'-kinase
MLFDTPFVVRPGTGLVYRRGVLGGVRTTIARWLEEGSLSSPAARALGRACSPLSDRALARPLVLPARGEGRARPLVTVTVGGATLGGSGKTRVALACARELASDSGVRVVVAPSRQAAIDLVVALVPRVDAVVLDGPLQLTPARASLSILALDAAAPWGAGAVPPAGDLRASKEALLAHADHVVRVDATPLAVRIGAPSRAVDLASFASTLRARRARIGLFTALARPDRLVRALTCANLEPSQLVRAPDHGPLTKALARRLTAEPDVDVWLSTAKCALHLEGLELGLPLAILDGSLDLPEVTAKALRELAETECDSRLHACLDPSNRKALLSPEGPRTIT